MADGSVLRWLRWAAALLGIAAIFVPALSVAAPGLAARWSPLEIATSIAGTGQKRAGQPSMGQILREMRQMRRQWERLGGRSPGAVPWAYRLAAGLPVALLAAAACAIVAILGCAGGGAGGWRWPVAGAAVLGVIAAGYTITTAALLTHAMHAEIAAGARRAQHALPLLGLLNLGTKLGAQIQVASEAGAYLFLAAFVALLLLPPAAKQTPHGPPPPMPS